MMEADKVLMGIIVDTSSSMQVSVGKDLLARKSRIIEVRDNLNAHFKRLTKFSNSNREVDVFCFGFGMRLPLNYNYVDIHQGKEKKGDSEVGFVADVICDLIGLTKMVLSRSEIEHLKQELNSTWKANSDKLISDINLRESRYPELNQYLKESLTEKAKKNWRYKLLNTTSKNKLILFLKNSLCFLLSIGRPSKKELLIESILEDESFRFSNYIRDATQKLFEKRKDEYSGLISSELSMFAVEQIGFILRKHAIGFKLDKILKYFDYEKTEKIASVIYGKIRKDVNKNFFSIWNKNRLKVFIESWIKCGVKVDQKYLKDLTQECVEYTGWKVLKPFIQQYVMDLFLDAFQQESEKMMPIWIHYATRTQEVVSLSELVSLLPETNDKEVYSSKFMFGTTPFDKAVERASLLLLNSKHSTSQKYLVIVSDGQVENESVIHETINMLKDEGVTIISLLVTTGNVITKLVRRMKGSWGAGTKFMFDISSKISDNESILRRLEKSDFSFEKNSKLVYQINESEKFGKVLDSITAPNNG